MGSTSEQHSEEHPTSVTRGLATVALLKVHFDAGRDHIGMFEPFVVDTLANSSTDGIAVEDVRAALESRHNFRLPSNTLQTLLSRIIRGGYLRREGGRYFPGQRPLPDTDLAGERSRVMARQEVVAIALRDYALAHGLNIQSNDDALALLVNFLDQFHVALALGAGATLAGSRLLESEEGASTDDVSLVASFLDQRAIPSDELRPIVEEMLEGFILQNTLLLKDISSTGRGFDKLRVIFDSSLLFAALGFRGPANETATRELVGLLRQTGAIPEVLEPTIREMQRILRVYEEHLATSEGRLSLYPTDLTRFILTSQWAPSDARTASATLETNLNKLGFNVREMPRRASNTTFDEPKLAKLLADPRRPGDENGPRVLHDVDCVAAVLAVRGGETSDALERARAVFVTASGLTVQHTAQWYKDEVGKGALPIIHFLALSNLAWLKKPASASQLKVHELMALCAAALRPTREVWNRFLKHLRRLQDSGQLTSDEVTAIVASSLTDQLLVEDSIDEDSDAATLGEVVERVRASYAARAAEDLERAQGALQASEDSRRLLETSIISRADRAASAFSWTATFLVAAALIAGSVISLVDLARGRSPSVAAICLALAPLAAVALCGALWGFHVNGWRIWIRAQARRRILRWIAGEASTPQKTDPSV
jgi:hypothetical protein